MAEKKLRLWLDGESDFLEVSLEPGVPGVMEPTEDDRVMVKVADDGRVIGFHILGVSTIKGAPFDLELAPASHEDDMPKPKRAKLRG
ncbi:MAG: DUF2283 domain-containing protein [Chloroflexi bacterium]|nr:DUF2283 domain-containing protein [Chloroflexota bacterium]